MSVWVVAEVAGADKAVAGEHGAGAALGVGLRVSHALHRSTKAKFSSVQTAHAQVLPATSSFSFFLRLAALSALASPPLPAVVGTCSFDLDGRVTGGEGAALAVAVNRTMERWGKREAERELLRDSGWSRNEAWTGS